MTTTASNVALQKHNEEYYLLVENATVAVLVVRDGVVQCANRITQELFERPEAEIIGHALVGRLLPDDWNISAKDPPHAANTNPQCRRREVCILCPGGRTKWISLDTVEHSWQGSPATFHYATDITPHRQAEAVTKMHLALIEYARVHSVPEVLQQALDQVTALTGSTIGFYHFVESDQQNLSLQAWSTRTVQEFCQAEGRGMHYPVAQAGVWADCVHLRKPVIHNDYAALPHRKGLPKGHALVVRELAVPIMRGGHVVAILGVGNKAIDYDAEDV